MFKSDNAHMYIYNYLFVNTSPVFFKYKTGIGVPQDRCREMHQNGRFVICATRPLRKDDWLFSGNSCMVSKVS